MRDVQLTLQINRKHCVRRQREALQQMQLAANSGAVCGGVRELAQIYADVAVPTSVRVQDLCCEA
jgi:hypothetical protein